MLLDQVIQKYCGFVFIIYFEKEDVVVVMDNMYNGELYGCVFIVNYVQLQKIKGGE